MDPTTIVHLSIALAAIAAAIICFNTLSGKGPRGTVWFVAASVLTWGVMLPIVLRDPVDLSLTREMDLIVVVLQLCAAIGAILGILDVLQQRTTERRHAIAEWAVRQPLVWGLVVGAWFYALLYQGVIDSPKLWRYMAGHWVEVVEGAFFFVGMAMLVLRLVEIAGQRKSAALTTLGAVPLGGQRVEDCEGLMAQLNKLPARIQQSYLARRLREAVEFVRRKGSADSLDAHLRHLEELDAVNMHSAYATLRIIIWAIPILGFLGTVIGITVAITNLSPKALEQSMPDVTKGLGVAFDTTAQALALTMILMFTKALVEKVEGRLLGDVDAKVAQELLGRFPVTTVEADPNVAVVRRMSEQVLGAVESLAVRQAEAWRSSIDETHHHWAEMNAATGRLVRDTFSDCIRDNFNTYSKTLDEGAVRHAEKLDRSAQETVGRLREGIEKLAELLVEALQRHGEVLTKSENDLAQANRQHLSEVEAALGRSMVVAAERQENLVLQSEQLLKEMQIALVEAAGTSLKQQEELVRQGDVLLKVVNATGQIKKLEAALNHNLATVGRVYNFEEMALNLSAAIQLLSARLGHHNLVARGVEIAGDEVARGAA
ncbi:MAG TPA: MotA/TolQ/ExbB proton channel family protein [Lacipirellulaceae bacterium]